MTVGPHEVTVTSSVTVTDQVLAEAAATKPAMAMEVRILDDFGIPGFEAEKGDIRGFFGRHEESEVGNGGLDYLTNVVELNSKEWTTGVKVCF